MTKLSERQLRWLFGGVGTGCFALLLGLETMTDTIEITPLEFLGDAASLLLTIGSAVGVALLLQRIQAQHEEQMALTRDLAIARAEGNTWRSKVQSHLAGLKEEVERQFQDWGMTAAEREVGLLILKGLSHKEIAVLRATTDATVRQQAQSIYRKAGLPGKTAFSAYFLEDLFASDTVTNGSGPAASRGHDGISHPVRTPMPRRVNGNGGQVNS
jgi:DNA-binding CsgD family transcriptional regulator